MAGAEELHAIAAEFSTADHLDRELIRYRRVREKLVHRVGAEAELPTRYGRGRDHRLRRGVRDRRSRSCS